MAAYEELPSSLQDLWNEQVGGGLPIHWVLIADGVDAEGESVIEYAWSENTKTWHLRGMLGEFLAAQDQGQLSDLIIGELTGDDDG